MGKKQPWYNRDDVEVPAVVASEAGLYAKQAMAYVRERKRARQKARAQRADPVFRRTALLKEVRKAYDRGAVIDPLRPELGSVPRGSFLYASLMREMERLMKGMK